MGELQGAQNVRDSRDPDSADADSPVFGEGADEAVHVPPLTDAKYDARETQMPFVPAERPTLCTKRPPPHQSADIQDCASNRIASDAPSKALASEQETEFSSSNASGGASKELGENTNANGESAVTDMMYRSSRTGRDALPAVASQLPRRKRGRPRKEELLARKLRPGGEPGYPDGTASHTRWRTSASAVDIPRTVHIMYDYPEPKSRSIDQSRLDSLAQATAAKALASLAHGRTTTKSLPAVSIGEPCPAGTALRVLPLLRRAGQGTTFFADGSVGALSAEQSAPAIEERKMSDQVVELVSKSAAPSNPRSPEKS